LFVRVLIAAVRRRDTFVVFTMQRDALPLRGELLIVLDVRHFSFPVNGWAITVDGWILTMEWRREGGSRQIMHVLLLSAGDRLVPTPPAAPPPGWR
jgi:hypothetical protein